MNAEENEQRIEELFAQAKDLEPEERRAFLDEACREDPPEVREAVEKLLAADDRNAALRRPAEAPLQGGAIRLNCPHCHNPIELVVDQEEEVICPSCGSSFHLDAGRTQTWRKDKLPTLGKFSLLSRIGFGAFGTVYKAFDSELKRTVALKIPRSGTLTAAEDEDRFFREARNAAQLRHSGIVPVFEVGRSDQFPYIVSELVEGITLADALTGRKFGFREAAQLVRQLAEALDYSHKQGVVHRDLKPSNIMLTADDTPRIMDFGLAKREAGEITMTMDGQVLGTPAYMSPEQASGKAHEVDGRSDVYSLGVILFELLTGELPFRGNPRMLLHQVLHSEPRTPRSLNDRVPRDLETVCLKAMAKEPKRRYQTARECGQDLGRYLNGEPIHSRPVGRMERAWRWCRRNPRQATLVALLLVVLTAGTAVSSYFAVASHSHAVRADKSVQEGKERLRKSLLAQAQAGRYGGQIGRRFDGLQALKEAASIRPGLDLRNEAIACMALVDVCVAKEWDGCPGGVGDIQGLFFDAKLERYARGDENGNVSIRRVSDDSEIVQLPGAGMPARSVQFSDDGKMIAVNCHRDPELQLNEVSLWNLSSPKRVLHLSRQMNANAMGFSPDGRLFAIGHQDGSVRLYDTSTADEVRSIPSIAAHDVLFHPNGNLLAISGHSSTEVREVATGKLVQTLGAGLALAWHPDGQLLAIGYTSARGSRIDLWNTNTRTFVRRLDAPSRAVIDGLAFNPLGDLLANSAWGYVVALWDPYSGRKLLNLGTVDLRGVGRRVKFSATGDRLAYRVSGTKVQLWELARDVECLQFFGTGGADAAFHPNGRVIAVSDEEGVRLWDQATHEPLAFLPLPFAQSVHFHPSGNYMIVSASSGLYRLPIHVADADEFQHLEIGVPEVLWKEPTTVHAAMSPDGRYVAAASGAGDVILMNNDDRKRIVHLNHPYGAHVTISPDRTWVATATWKGQSVKIWSTNGKLICELPDNINSAKVSFSPDGQWLVTSQPEEYCFWKVGLWKSGLRIPTSGNADVPGDIAFSPNSKIAAIQVNPATVRLIDAANGNELATLIPPDRENIGGFRFNSDGSQLAVSAQGVLQVWDLRAIRKQLADMGLDWQFPSFPPAPKLSTKRVRVTVIGEVISKEEDPLFRQWAAAEDQAASQPDHEFVTPPAVGLLEARAGRYAQESQWDMATSDYHRVIDLEPLNHRAWFCLAALLVHRGHKQAYRDHCERMLDTFEGSGNLAAINLTTKACLLAPYDGVDKQRLNRLFERSIKYGDNSTRGLFEYRRSNYELAIQWLRKHGREREFSHVPTQSELILAMAYARLGRAETARATLEAAAQKMDSMPRTNSFNPDFFNFHIAWQDVLICWIFREEAEKVVAELTGDTATKELETSNKSKGP